MNERIPLKRFAEKVAAAAGVTPAIAEEFIKSLFSLVSDELRTGQPVKIKGLGEFLLTSDPAEPVRFVPEAVWADEVNAPFAMFEAVEVSTNLSDEDFDKITYEAPHREDTTATVEAPAEQPVAEEPTETEAAETVAIEAVEPEETTETEETAETAPVETAPVQEEKIAATETVVTEKPKYRWPEEEEEDEQPSPEPEPTTTLSQQTSVDEGSTPSEAYAGEAAAVESDSRSGFGRGFIVGLIVGLAIGALALCGYVLYYVGSDTGYNPPADTEELVDEAVATDEIPF